VRAAQATLRQAKDDDESDAVIAQDQAALDQARIQLKMAQTQAGYAVVTSPLSGVALEVPANVGENASPGQTLAVIGDVGHLTVSVYVSEAQIGQVKVGQTGTLTTDSTGDKTFPVKVTSVASQAEFTPASIETKDQRVKLVYEVRLDVSDKSGALKPGMPADVKL
jgi:HlyD family secretion protein